jgi:hypothetical protein
VFIVRVEVKGADPISKYGYEPSFLAAVVLLAIALERTYVGGCARVNLAPI